ncbi:hypothetical protein Dsin_017233, partial [Dipteronia sinensis]
MESQNDTFNCYLMTQVGNSSGFQEIPAKERSEWKSRDFRSHLIMENEMKMGLMGIYKFLSSVFDADLSSFGLRVFAAFDSKKRFFQGSLDMLFFLDLVNKGSRSSDEIE